MSRADAPATAGAHVPVAGQHALVVGIGTSGQAAATALIEAGLRVTAVDEDDVGEVAADLAERGARVEVAARPEEHLEDVDLVVLSPGVPASAPVVAAAGSRGLPVWSEPELAWRLHGTRPLLGVTGTNGKTSTVELAAAMLSAGGVQAVACGNIGTPLVAAAGQAGPETTLVAELSSFQLRFSYRLRPAVGVLLNVAADHLDWHGGLEAYAQAKARLWQAQRATDWAVINADDPMVQRLAAEHAPGRLARFSANGPVDGPGVGVEDGVLVADLPAFSGELLAVDELALAAPHHRANVAAAAAAALLAGSGRDGAVGAARSWTPGHHRLETVAERDGVVWVDDSKATNPHAVAAALAAVGSGGPADAPPPGGDGPRIVWIAGGAAKGVDLTVLAEDLGGVRHAVLLGEAADALAAVCAGADVPATRVGSMGEAVAAAARRARPGDTVLLAPACASFDMFDDYADRGRQFAAAVEALEVDGRV